MAAVTGAVGRWKGQGHQDGDSSAAAGILFGILAAAGIAQMIANALKPNLEQIYLEGYAIGTRAANAAATRQTVDWTDWKPGTPPAATDPGLDPLVRGAGQAAADMADTRIATLARRLTAAVQRGETGEQITALIHATLHDPDRAYQIALTELVKAQSAATITAYQRHGIAEHVWADAEDTKVCATCEENAKQGAVRVGMPFQSGDIAPPNHPGDRCALLPVNTPLGDDRA